MNRPHKGIKGLKKKSRSKKGCPQREEAKERPISRKNGLRQSLNGLRNFHFNTLYGALF